MITLAILAALATAACWAVSPFLAYSPSKTHGAFAFVRMRTIFAAVMLLVLLAAASPFGLWRAVAFNHMLIFAATGVIGIAGGDVLYFAAIRRVGPRRAAMLFTTNAPLAFIFAAVIIGEFPSLLGILGCAATLGGVILAIRYGGEAGSFRSETDRFEITEGSLLTAAALGVGAASMQALAMVMVHGMAHTGFDPVTVTVIRVVAAALVFAPMPLLPFAVLRAQNKMDANFLMRAAVVGFIAMVLGISLLNFALAQDISAGIVASLLATQPVLIVFIQWALTQTRPRAGAFAGAAAAVIGVVMLSTAPY